MLVTMVASCSIRDIKYPTKEEIYQEFEQYDSTDNTVVVSSSLGLYFGNSSVCLNLLDSGNTTGDWFIFDKKIYFSCYERERTSPKCYRIFECDFNGDNLREVYCFERENSYKISTYGNAFYISDNTYLNVFIPSENRWYKESYEKSADDYVKELKQLEQPRFKRIKNSEKAFIFEDVHTSVQYTINDETLKNSAEGRSLLKYKHYFYASISDDRILVTAHVYSKGSLNPYVTYEYDLINDKLVFQNYCEINLSFDALLGTYDY